MIAPITAISRRIFPERQFLLRSGERVRYLSLPGWVQAGAVAVTLTVLLGVGGLAGAYHNLHKALHRKEAEIGQASVRAAAVATLRQQLAIADEQYFLVSSQFDEAKQLLDSTNADNEALRASIDAGEGRAAVLDKERIALEQSLNGAEQALASKSGNLTTLAKQLADNRDQLREAELARGTLQKKLQQLQTDSETADSRSSQLKLALATREHDLKSLATERDRLRSQLDQAPVLATAKSSPAHFYGSELEQLVASTGIDIDKILGRLATPTAQGGPYVAFDPRGAIRDQDRRDEELRTLVKSLPLAAPLAHYVFESGFGPRLDPILGRPAFHYGVDLSAPYRTQVLATAPGVVTFSGVKDEFGRVVEIAHAHGIVTVYAHLHRTLVVQGQKVALQQPIGELGSTGRSTGPHVHYEVRVDGTALDPAKFMDAGKNVVQASAK